MKQQSVAPEPSEKCSICDKPIEYGQGRGWIFKGSVQLPVHADCLQRANDRSVAQQTKFRNKFVG